MTGPKPTRWGMPDVRGKRREPDALERREPKPDRLSWMDARYPIPGVTDVNGVPLPREEIQGGTRDR